VLLAELPFPPEELAFGHTKIFIRSPRTVSLGMGARGGPHYGAVRRLRGSHRSPRLAGGPESVLGVLGDAAAPGAAEPLPRSVPSARPGRPQLFDLERRRRERVAQLAALIQKTFRGWRCRTQYRLMRKSQIVIAAWFRGHTVRKGGPGCGPPAHPSTLGKDPGPPQPPRSPLLSPPQQKNRYRQVKRSALIIQAYARGWKVRAGRAGAAGWGWQVSQHGQRGGGARRGGPVLRVPHGGTRLISAPRLRPRLPLSRLSASRSVSVSVSPHPGVPGRAPRSLAGSSGS